jgi:hypothetical protein
MKMTFDFENGMQLILKPENVNLVDNGGKETVLITKTDQSVIPLVFFKTVLLASPSELQARAVIAAELVKAEADKVKKEAAAKEATAKEAELELAPELGP